MKDSKRGGLRGPLQYANMVESESGATREDAVDKVSFFLFSFGFQ